MMSLDVTSDVITIADADVLDATYDDIIATGVAEIRDLGSRTDCELEWVTFKHWMVISGVMMVCIVITSLIILYLPHVKQ